MHLFPGQSLDDIADGEPVYLVRASDVEAASILRKAAFLYLARHGAGGLAAELSAFADEVTAWQHTDGNAAPPPERDTPPAELEDELEDDQAEPELDVEGAVAAGGARPDLPDRVERRR